MRILITTLSFLLLFSGCNNQRISRLSAQHVCKENSDPAAFSLSQKEIKDDIFVSIPASELPTDQAFIATTVITSLDIELENEEKAIITLSNRALSINPTAISIACINGFGLNSHSDPENPITFNTPLTNAKGEVIYQTTTIEYGNPKKEDKSDFLRIVTIPVPAAEPQTADPVTPKPFSSFFSAEGDELAYYKLKDDKNKTKTYYIHYKNDRTRVRSRISLQKIVDKK